MHSRCAHSAQFRLRAGFSCAHLQQRTQHDCIWMPGELVRVESAGNEFDMWSRALKATMVMVLIGMQVGGRWIEIQRLLNEIKMSTEAKTRKQECQAE